MKQAMIDGTLMTIVSFENFIKYPELNQNTNTAVQMGDVIYPYRSSVDVRPGIYRVGGPAGQGLTTALHMFKQPKETDMDYRTSSPNYVDYDDAKTMEELLQKQAMVRTMESEIVSSPDNITTLMISDKDTPEMRGFKEAINAKQIDIDKYSYRFGTNWPNEKRLMKGHKITLDKIQSIGDNFDMCAVLILRDKNGGDVPNPIGKEIVIDLSKEGD